MSGDELTIELTVPDPGDAYTESEIVEWLEYAFRRCPSASDELPMDEMGGEEVRPTSMRITRDGRRLCRQP